MRWVVISDIHAKFAENFKTPDLREKLLTYLKMDREKNGEYEFVLITGDVMYKFDRSGSETYINQLMEACGIGGTQLYLCPGNHDVTRKDEERNKIIEDARKNSGDRFPKFTDEYMGYDRFNTIYLKVCGKEYKHFKVHNRSEKNYRVVSIDSCLLSKDKEDQRNLKVCAPELVKLNGEIADDSCLNILIMHHACSWLTPTDSKEFQHWMGEHHIDIAFCGHEHDAGETVLPETGSARNGKISQYVCGPCLSDKETQPSFYICEYDPEKNQEKIEIALHILQNDGNWGKGEGSCGILKMGFQII